MVLRRLLFEGKRRAIAEARVEPYRVVVSHVVVERGAELPLVREDDAPGEFRLERVEERLHVRVVTGPTHARTLHEAKPREVGAERGTHVLRAAVAVEDHTTAYPARRRSACEHSTRNASGPPARE